MTGLRTHAWIAVLLAVALGQRAMADPPPADAEILTAETAVASALQHNPELAVARKQRGIAQANVVIARTYPFNPLFTSLTLAARGNDVVNHTFTENYIRIDVEMRGQMRIRKAAAAAALSRTESEIAAQELSVAVRTLRAFTAFIYRQDKMRLLEDTIKLQDQTVQKVKLLADQGKLKAADLMLARADLVEAQAQRGPANAVSIAAWNDLRKVIGAEHEFAGFNGRLEPFLFEDDATELIRHALSNRPDLHALHLAVIEADHRARLEVANRFGNPSIGPAMEYNETGDHFWGVYFVLPLPALNCRKGEIMLRVAERDKALQDKRRVEIQTTFDVKAAIARLAEAQKWVKHFGSESLPTLQTTMDAFEKLFAAGEPGVDVGRLIDARRRLLRARDGYLDALWELNQARIDLAAAVGDIELALPPREVLPVPTPPSAESTNRPHLLPPVAQH